MEFFQILNRYQAIKPKFNFMNQKYLGLTATICAFALSTFTKPSNFLVFKLLHDPTSSNIVNNDYEWSTGGQYFGNCIIVQPDIACRIDLADYLSSFYHPNGIDQILNTFTYANMQSPKEDYLEITETTGKDLGGGVFDRIITSIQPKHYNILSNKYENVSLGIDLAFANRKD